MHQSQNLSLQQVLAPQLQQSLLILQAPLLELRNLVQQEMETNPVLEELATDPNDETEDKPAKAKELGFLDAGTFGASVRELPDGAVQMYIRDPAGNLVEIDWPDISSLDRSVVAAISRLEDERPQTGVAAGATLYHAAGDRAP